MSNQSIGQAIRDLRRQRNMTGGELAKRIGLSQSKISKIETGADVNISHSRIEKILNILEAPQTIRQQIQSTLGRPESVHLRRIRSRPAAAHQEALDELRIVNLLRTFSLNIFPALLQTVEFREALFKHLAAPEDAHEAVMRITLKRQDLLWDRRRHFHFILHETVLYTAPGDHVIQIGQLDRIDRLIGARNIKIGIIPLEAGTPPLDLCAFVLHDERFLYKAVTGTDIKFSDPEDVAEHLKLFASLERLAGYGDGARALIHKAMDHFS